MNEHPLSAYLRPWHLTGASLSHQGIDADPKQRRGLANADGAHHIPGPPFGCRSSQRSHQRTAAVMIPTSTKPPTMSQKMAGGASITLPPLVAGL